MGEETARLRREIDRTREDLTRDVDLIADKTSPSRIVERRVERTRRGIAGIKERIMGTHDDDTAGRGRGATPSDPFGISDPYPPGVHREPVDGPAYGEQTGGWSRSSGAPADRVRDGLESARDSVSGATATMTGKAHDTVGTARRQTEGNPLAAGLVAFGVGWLVSSLLPATGAEVAATRRAQETAREHGGGVAEQAKQAAAEIGDNLRGSAEEAVEQVKGHAQEAARTVKDEGASAARTVQDDARDTTSAGRSGTPAV